MRTEELRKHRRLLGGLIERVLELEVRSNRRVFTEPHGGCSGARGGRPNVTPRLRRCRGSERLIEVLVAKTVRLTSENRILRTSYASDFSEVRRRSARVRLERR